MKQSKLYLKLESNENTLFGKYYNMPRTRYYRHSKSSNFSIDEDDSNYSMHPKTKYIKSRASEIHDYHYYNWDPLFHELLKSVGKKWNDVWKSIYPRVDNMYEPIMVMVANCKKNGLINNNVDISNQHPCFIYGETSYWSKLYIDENGILQYIDKNYVPAIQYGGVWGQSFNGRHMNEKTFNPN